MLYWCFMLCRSKRVVRWSLVRGPAWLSLTKSIMAFMFTPCVSFVAIREQVSLEMRVWAMSFLWPTVINAGHDQPVFDIPWDLSDRFPVPFKEPGGLVMFRFVLLSPRCFTNQLFSIFSLVSFHFINSFQLLKVLSSIFSLWPGACFSKDPVNYWAW